MSTHDLEKNNLEAHIELSTLREENIQEKLKDLGEKLETFMGDLKELQVAVTKIKEDRNNQLISWGSAIIMALISVIGALILKILLPLVTGK